MENKDKKGIAESTVATYTGGAVLGGGVIKHNIEYNKLQKDIQAKATKSQEAFSRKLKPGDILLQEYSRRKSTKVRPTAFLGKHEPKFLKKHAPTVRFNDMIKSFYGHPQTHAAMYTGRIEKQYMADPGHKVIHAQGGGESVSSTRLDDIMNKSNVVAVRPKVTDAARKKAIKYAKDYTGQLYSERMKGDIARELITGVKHQGRQCTQHSCTTLVSEAYGGKTKTRYEHPMEMVKRNQADIVAKFEGAKDIGRLESIPSRLIAPVARNLKYAVPAAALAGVGAFAYNKLKKNPS